MDIPPLLNQAAGNGTLLPKGLNVGDKLPALVLKNENGILTLNIGGSKLVALAEGIVISKNIKIEIIKLEPQLMVKILPSGDDAKVALEKSSADILLGMKQAAMSAVLKEVSSFSQSDIAKILKMFGMAKIAAFTPDEIRKVIKDGGNFFENKLLNGISLKNDAKLEAYLAGNEPARSAVTKLQTANVLMTNDFLTFFDASQDLDIDNGIMRFRRTDDGYLNLFMKVDFTNLGETILTFARSKDTGYNITIRTEADISDEIGDINIPGAVIRWVKLKKSDADFFEIKPGDFETFINFDIKA